MNRILITTTASTPHGQLFIESLNHLVLAQQNFDRVNDAMTQMMYGDPPDYAQVALEMGLVDAAAAADLVSLLANAMPALNAAILLELVARCDQGG